jgi:Putative beta-lactamase-inhibitor-like, PepSY-like
MKQLMISCAIIIMIAASCNAQNAPAAVTKAFQAKFPDAKNIKWGKENAHEYEAEFTDGAKKVSANFTDKGEWVETETMIETSALPQKVLDAFHKSYPNITIAGADKIEKSNGTTHYEVEYKSGAKLHEIIFDEEGKQI